MSNPYPKSDNDIWPEWRIERLRDLVESGLSAREVGVHLGCSRMAILGKCRRMRIPLLIPPVGGTKRLMGGRYGPPAPPVARPPRVRRVGPVSLPALASVPVQLPPPPAPVLVPLLTGECCWPLGEPRTRGFRYCDAPCDVRRTYCTKHHKDAHLKRKVAEMVEA
jgi:GcrA cell cycle regulator